MFSSAATISESPGAGGVGVGGGVDTGGAVVASHGHVGRSARCGSIHTEPGILKPRHSGPFVVPGEINTSKSLFPSASGVRSITDLIEQPCELSPTVFCFTPPPAIRRA